MGTHRRTKLRLHRQSSLYRFQMSGSLHNLKLKPVSVWNLFWGMSQFEFIMESNQPSFLPELICNNP